MRGGEKSVVMVITDLPMELQMKNIFLIPVFAGFIALTSSVSAQAQPGIKAGIISINEPIIGEFSYYQLDSQRWVVAVLTEESTRADATNRKAPSPFLITCSKEQISISGTPLFDVEKLPSGDAYSDVVAVSFCTEMRKSFGTQLPIGF